MRGGGVAGVSANEYCVKMATMTSHGCRNRFHEVSEKWIREHRQEYRGNRAGDLQDAYIQHVNQVRLFLHQKFQVILVINQQQANILVNVVLKKNVLQLNDAAVRILKKNFVLQVNDAAVRILKYCRMLFFK
jgi:hypothetical protein